MRFLLTGLAGIVLLFSFVGIAGFVAGGVTQIIRDTRCINSACVNPCKTSVRFIRHAGCSK